jgi:hypothetical protein
MLIVAGILFILALLLLFVDKFFDSANMDLSWPVRILVFLAAALIVYHSYRSSRPEGPVESPASAETAGAE